MKLSRLFNRQRLMGIPEKLVTMSVVRVMGTYASRDMVDRIRNKSGLPLSKDEAALVSGVFGDQINTGTIRKHFHNRAKKGAYASVEPFSRRHIDFWGKANCSDDYANDSDRFRFGLFLHEVTHIWQHQNYSMLENMINQDSRYSYELTDKSHFDDFFNEQQASIIEDYAKRFLYPAASRLKRSTLSAYKKNLKRVVEEAFPAARKTRLALDAQERQGRCYSVSSPS